MMAVELGLKEEQVKKLWDDESLLSLISGCKNVHISLDVSGGKYLVVIPISIIFENWTIELDPEMAKTLAKIVDLVVIPVEE